VHLAHHSSFDFFILNLSSLKHCRPILTEFKTTKEFEKRQSSSDVFFVFVKDESEQSGEYKVLSYENLNLQPCRSLNIVLIVLVSENCSSDCRTENFPSHVLYYFKYIITRGN
jgi:hypothetical protein